MRRNLVLAAALLAFPASAHAATPKQPHFESGIRDGDKVYVMRGQTVLVQGARPFAEAGTAVATITWRRHLIGHERVALRGKPGAANGIRFRFRPWHVGGYKVAIAVYKAPDTATPVRSSVLTLHVIRPRAQLGSHGLYTRLLQRGLRSLAYVSPLNGRYDDATGRAVLAFRKVNGLNRIENASWTVFWDLFRGKGGFKLKYKRGRHLEFDWSRQVLVFAQNGRPVRIYHASSGKPSTPTVFGTFHFYLKTPGTNSEGMVDSNYFIRGYAVHGYAEVPPYAASHGCIRVPIPDAASIYDWIRVGDKIYVYA